jgi:hypothetical protein
MFLTYGDVMVNDLFITGGGLPSSVEAAEMLIDADICQHASCLEIYLQS